MIMPLTAIFVQKQSKTKQKQQQKVVISLFVPGKQFSKSEVL